MLFCYSHWNASFTPNPHIFSTCSPLFLLPPSLAHGPLTFLFWDSVSSCFHPRFLVQRRTVRERVGECCGKQSCECCHAGFLFNKLRHFSCRVNGKGEAREREREGVLFIPLLFWKWSDFPSLGTIGPLCLFSSCEGKRGNASARTWTHTHTHRG